MKVWEVISETMSAGATGAGGIATIAKPMKGIRKRNKDTIFASKDEKVNADEQQPKGPTYLGYPKMIRRQP